MMVIANVFPKLQTVKNFEIPQWKKRRFRTRFDRHFYQVFLSLWEKFIWKMSPRLFCENLEGFLKHWLPMPSILLEIGRFSNSKCKCNYLKNEKLFLNCWFHFWNLHKILNILKSKMMVIANAFPKLETVKNFVRPLCQNPCVRTRFDSQHMRVSQKLAKSPWERFYHVFPSFWWKLVWKMSPVVLGKILGVFVKTWTADAKYPVQYCENLQLPIQLQLSEKRQTLSQFFVPFLESTSIFQHFEIKDDGHS